MDIHHLNGFDCTYESYTDCENSGCCNDGNMCRCSKYELSSFSAEITDIFNAFIYLSDAHDDLLFNYKFLAHLDFGLYPIRYIFNDCIDLNNIRDLEIDPQICGGYYGEEIHSIELTNSLDVYEDINKQLGDIFSKYGLGNTNTNTYDEPKDRDIINQYVLALIKYQLSKTNNNIKLSSVEKVNKWYLKNMTLGEILQTVYLPNQTHIKTLRNSKKIWEVVARNNYFTSLNLVNYPYGVLLKKKGKLYLINGYHRYLMVILHYPNTTISYIILEEA